MGASFFSGSVHSLGIDLIDGPIDLINERFCGGCDSVLSVDGMEPMDTGPDQPVLEQASASREWVETLFASGHIDRLRPLPRVVLPVSSKGRAVSLARRDGGPSRCWALLLHRRTYASCCADGGGRSKEEHRMLWRRLRLSQALRQPQESMIGTIGRILTRIRGSTPNRR